MARCIARSGSRPARPAFRSLRTLAAALFLPALLFGPPRTSSAQQTAAEPTAADQEKLNLALCEAIQKNDVPTVRALIKNGADLKWFNPQQNRKTPLIIAIMYTQAKPQGKLDMVNLLLESGADVHWADGSGKYPILYSVFSTVEVAQRIIDKGGNQEINLYGSATEKQPYGIGKTALTCVCTYSNVTSEMIPILLKAGADPNQRSHNGQGLPVLLCGIRNDNPKNFDKVKAVQCLIEHGADVNLKGRLRGDPKETERSALGEAIKLGDQAIIEMLKKAGAKE
jgi:ankyrin repeat protein